MSAAVALAAGWTDPDFVSTTTGGICSTCDPWWVYPWDCYRPYYLPAPAFHAAQKVVLKSSEVDRLRTAAKRDAKLKAVLEKLTPCIEVEIEL